MFAIAREEGNTTMKPWRLHDLRRSFVTGLIELKIPPHVVEVIVNHISGARGGVAGVYNVAELLPERREAMERWSRHVLGMLRQREENVVTLRHNRGK
jgi:hypothetical protein